jgi:hypothetical protein
VIDDDGHHREIEHRCHARKKSGQNLLKMRLCGGGHYPQHHTYFCEFDVTELSPS